MVCWLFNDSLEIRSCGEGLRGFVKHETKGGLAPQSTVSGLRDFRKMHTSIWKNLVWNHLCVCQTEVFLQWKYLLRKKRKLKVFFSMQSFPSACPKCGFCSFWPSETLLAAQPPNGSAPWLGTFRFQVLVLWDWWFKCLCLVKNNLHHGIFSSPQCFIVCRAALLMCRLCHHFIRPFMKSFFHSDMSVLVRNVERRLGACVMSAPTALFSQTSQ